LSFLFGTSTVISLDAGGAGLPLINYFRYDNSIKITAFTPNAMHKTLHALAFLVFIPALPACSTLAVDVPLVYKIAGMNTKKAKACSVLCMALGVKAVIFIELSYLK
jgi:hypothetical protein